MVRPHLDNAVQVWNPSIKGDVNALEKVRRRAKKIPFTLKVMQYEMRIARMGLKRLSERGCD